MRLFAGLTPMVFQKFSAKHQDECLLAMFGKLVLKVILRLFMNLLQSDRKFGNLIIKEMKMKLSDFKVLTFDCYGTLIDWENGMLNALAPLTNHTRVNL